VLQLKTIQMKNEIEKLKKENKDKTQYGKDLLYVVEQLSIRLGELHTENKELKNDVWNWEKKYNLLFETYTEFLNQVNNK
jgi:hypothetical protein